MKYIIKQNQCGFLMLNGKYIKMLDCGKHYYASVLGYQVIVTEMKGRVLETEIPLDVLLTDQCFSQKVMQVKIPDGYLGIIYTNGVKTSVMSEREVVFWNVFEKYECELVDMRGEPEIGSGVQKDVLSMIPLRYYKKVEIAPGESGLLYYDNQLVKELGSGTYYFWNHEKDVLCRIVDLKRKELEVTGQEILTADRVGIRLNLVCSYRISDSRKMVETIKGLESQIHTCVQLITREYVGRYRLDEILEQKVEISSSIFAQMKQVEEHYCLEFLSAGIKDIILPGEIREIMNTVLIAEKRAQANVITRREEVASTRSLLNTAKLMDENQTLYKLKEMECMERICNQVGNINVAGGENLLAQLTKMLACV